MKNPGYSLFRSIAYFDPVKTIFIVLITAMCSLLFCTPAHAQQLTGNKSIKKEWTTNNPFKTDVFIENHGQFNSWVKSDKPVEYAINRSEKIFFTPDGLIYKIDTAVSDENEPEGERPAIEMQEDKEHHYKTLSYFVSMTWEGCNKDAVLTASDEAEGYYTFGEKGYENVKAKGYKKLTYKNLYPGIDVEYIFPENKSGIKYRLIISPGADVSAIKMNYSGDIENIIKDINGNILIKTPAGIITDHAPVSYYQNDFVPVNLAFKFSETTVRFNIVNDYDTSKTLIVDPWTTVPVTLTTDNTAYDLDFDDYGNVYVAGGTVSISYELAKYSAAGNLLWTFTTPLNWSPVCFCYSKFCLLPHSGTVLMGEGFNENGPRVMKINTFGTLEITSPNFPPNNEIWVMFYNRCQGKLIAFGGGTQDETNVNAISDTNLNNSIPSNFNGNPFICNDISSAKMDFNGDFYALMPASSAGTDAINKIQKSLVSTNYNPPLAFNVNCGYDFYECYNSGIPGFTQCGNGSTVRANALALNIHYLFSYDGQTLNAWNKTTGALLGSIIVNSAYTGGQYRTHEGIIVDDCNNVYVGGTNKVHVYAFSGSVFTEKTPVTTNIPNEVYDLTIDQNTGMLYVSGLGFVTTIETNACITNQLTLAPVGGDCSNTASIIVSGGMPPYRYLWSNGATTSSITGSSGMYSVTVTDNSCIVLKGTDSVEICSLTIPNVFTPQNDGYNDEFVILYDGNEPYHLMIYNRWGVLMFESKDKNHHWNGKAPNGLDASDGVYYYVLAIGKRSYNGTVTLLR